MNEEFKMAMLDKKVAQERLDVFYDKLKASGKSWDEYLKERDADADKHFSKTKAAAKSIVTKKSRA